MFKSYLAKYPSLYLRLSLYKKIGFSKYIVNYFFQKIFRVNSRFPELVNFSSTVVGEDISYHRDIKTLSSFALSGGVYIQALNGVDLGKNILIAPGVKIISANHDFTSEKKTVVTTPVCIGDNVWIGANAVILPGVCIASNCIVGAGSVVTKSFLSENSIIAGNPAKVIKSL